jgi:phage terminase small subunit
MPKLENDRHERFCLEYVKDLNAMQAAIRAGYKPNSAKSNTARLMENEGIQNRIAELTSSIRSDAIADAQERRERLSRIIRAQDTQTRVSRGCEYEAQPSFSDQIRAIEVLAKLEGDGIERLEVSASVSQTYDLSGLTREEQLELLRLSAKAQGAKP